MEQYLLCKDIERYGERVYEKEIDKYSKVLVYQYEGNCYIITKYRGELKSMLKSKSVYVKL